MGVGKILSLIDKKNLPVLVIGVILATGVLGMVASTESDAEYSVGSRDDDWWVSYPDQHADAGAEVDHPRWVLDALEDKPVIILEHIKNCKDCTKQESDIDQVLEDLGSNVTYCNIMADGGDERARGLYDVYNSNGGICYAPLTIVLTLVRDDDGNVVVGWHSVKKASGESWVRSYLEDAIGYHEENSGDWNE